MSKIEDALKKLQEGTRPLRRGGEARRAALARSGVSLASKKKVSIAGPKHHVSHVDLIRSGLLAPLDQTVPVADEFRRIKRPLITNAAGDSTRDGAPMNVIMITSALPSAGKTFCAVNLAVSISLEREINVLLVDADVAKPHISREFGLGDAPGLIDLLVDEGRKFSETLVRTDLNDIQVLPAGSAHAQATELLSSDRMSAITHELAHRYPDRLIILDSPPLLVTSEAQALADQVGQVLLVVEAARTSQQSLLQAIETLGSDKAVNLILNKSRPWDRSARRYGGDYEQYGSEYG